ncbi:MAG: endolytic transglycosylase MltG [Pseudomonadota bacterium]
MKICKKIFVVAVLLVLVAVGISTAVVYYGATRWKSPAAKEVIIRPGSSLRSISLELSRQKVIGTPKLFEIIARTRGISRTLRAGTYEFTAGITLNKVLDKIASGDVKQYAFTIVEGWNINEIAAALVDQPFLESTAVPENFVNLAHDPEFISSLGFTGIGSLEGYLFPETYLVEKPLNAEKLIMRLVAQFNQVWDELQSKPVYNEKISQADALTLASIVEKETGIAIERPLVASVFLNRLRAGMPLQSDPTIIYGLKDFDGNIRKQDISNPHEYNTYVHPGLPPGPIANPGKASLEAVLNPAKTDYFYFVSKGNGSHEFSSKLSEHLKAVREYQLKK